MTHAVAELSHTEVVRFDADQLEALCQSAGDDGAERAIAEALERLGQLMGALDAAWSVQDGGRLIITCRAIVEVARRIGMVTLASVARDVQTCVDTGDGPATAATYYRLKRLGHHSTHAIWSLDDISI